MKRLVCSLAFLCAAACLCGGGQARGAVYNIKVLSDKVCDLTDLPSFVQSATSRWTTNDRKARAIAHWFGRLGNQSGGPYDLMPVDPILFFNNFMSANCAWWTALYGAVGEGGMGWVGRHYEVGDHTIPELEYDGTRHYLDNTYKFYPLACDGERILSIIELDDVNSCGAHVPERNHELCWHTPMAICEDRDGHVPDASGGDTTPIRAWLPGAWLRRDAASRTYFREAYGYAELDESWVSDNKWREYVTESFHSVYRYILNLRDNEHYTRYWKQQGITSDYFYPTGGGADPDSAHNERGNGLWVFTPDLSADASFESLTNAARGTPAIHPASVGPEAVAVFKVQSANLTTGCLIEAQVYRADAGDSVVIEASSNAGHSWFSVWDNAGTGTVNVNENVSDALKGTHVAGDLRTVLNYLVRVRMTTDGSATDAGLNSIKITTITVCSRQALPKLGLGRNYITVDRDALTQHETKALRPLLKGTLYQREAVDEANIGTSASQESWSATLYSNSTSAEGHVTFQMDAPRAISRIRMGGAIWIRGTGTSDNYVRYEYRAFDGSWGGWTQAGLYDWDTRDNYHARRNQSKYEEVVIGTANVTSVQFKFVFRNSTAGYSGANALRMEVDYPAVDTTFKPIEVTYEWTEYYEPLPADEDSGDTRKHTERIASLPHSYYVNTGGDIRPRTNWVRVNLEGSSPDAVTLGYSDGTDVGDQYEIPPRRFVHGNLLSFNKPYTVSVNPNSDTYQEAGDDQELTDGHVKEPQVEGPWPPKCLAKWSDGVGTLELTVNLGSTVTVGGARVDAFYSKGETRFPNSVTVQTSTDGVTFTASGADQYKSARYALNGWPADWPLYPRYDSPDSAWGDWPNYGLRGNYIFVPFAAPVQATHVKFLIEQQPNWGFMLSEVHVWDSLQAERWTPKLTHGLPENNPPVLDPIGDKTVVEESTLSFTLSALDPDGDTVSYSATGLPGGATLDGSTGQFSWTPLLGERGEYVVTFTASDGKGGSDAETITITVSERDQDGDGIPDWWEMRYYSTIDDCLPVNDDDGDGLTNLEEYQQGTHPLDDDTDGDGIPDGRDRDPHHPPEPLSGGCGGPVVLGLVLLAAFVRRGMS